MKGAWDNLAILLAISVLPHPIVWGRSEVVNHGQQCCAVLWCEDSRGVLHIPTGRAEQDKKAFWRYRSLITCGADHKNVLWNDLKNNQRNIKQISFLREVPFFYFSS